MTIEDKNKLIAEFMGFKVEYLEDKKTYRGWGMYPYNSELHVRNLYNSKEDSWRSLLFPVKYHSEWNWLMEVIEKINNIKCSWDFDSIENVKFEEEIFNLDNTLSDFLNGDIEAIHRRTVEFVQWYNQQK